MTVPPTGKATQAPSARFEIKSAQLPLVALLLKQPEWDLVCADLLEQFGPNGEQPDFFDNDPLVIDFSSISRDLSQPDLESIDSLQSLFAALKQCRLRAVAFRGESSAWTAQLIESGLVQAPPDVVRPRNATPVQSEPVAKKQEQAPATLVVDKPLRSGQKVYARGGDLVVLAMVNQGAEVAADGNIHVYAPLRGKAMAGARGNIQARIFSLCMEPELVSIAGVYRTSENPLPENVAGKPAQIRLSNDGTDRLLFEPLRT